MVTELLPAGPPSSAAAAGRCVVNEAGVWEGKGQAQALSAALQDGALALLLLQVMLGRRSLSPSFSERCLWLLKHLLTCEHSG